MLFRRAASGASRVTKRKGHVFRQGDGLGIDEGDRLVPARQAAHETALNELLHQTMHARLAAETDLGSHLIVGRRATMKGAPLADDCEQFGGAGGEAEGARVTHWATPLISACRACASARMDATLRTIAGSCAAPRRRAAANSVVSVAISFSKSSMA